MSKELEALEPSVLLKFVDGLLKRYEGKTDYNIYITKEWLLEIKQALQRLEAIDNANPSEALKCLEEIDDMFYLNKYRTTENGNHEEYEFYPHNTKEYDIIEQALLKAQEQEKKLDRVEKLTNLLFKERRKIGQEYIKWCQKNNTVFDDATNMITWVLCIKLKEVLNND